MKRYLRAGECLECRLTITLGQDRCFFSRFHFSCSITSFAVVVPGPCVSIVGLGYVFWQDIWASVLSLPIQLHLSVNHGLRFTEVSKGYYAQWNEYELISMTFPIIGFIVANRLWRLQIVQMDRISSIIDHVVDQSLR